MAHVLCKHDFDGEKITPPRTIHAALSKGTRPSLSLRGGNRRPAPRTTRSGFLPRPSSRHTPSRRGIHPRVAKPAVTAAAGYPEWQSVPRVPHRSNGSFVRPQQKHCADQAEVFERGQMIAPERGGLRSAALWLPTAAITASGSASNRPATKESGCCAARA